jgi:pSer/pThr/pTyr-binding forkhead associated (FHA) protein
MSARTGNDRVDIKLKLMGGKHVGKVIEVRTERFIIGRGEDCHLRPSSEMVSRRHCALVVEGNQVRVCDFKSSNGTFVNGARIDSECTLADGDVVKVGPLEFAVMFTLSPQARTESTIVRHAKKDRFDTTDEAKQDDFIQQWLTDTPGKVGSSETVADKLDETHTGEPATTAGLATNNLATVGVSRIPPDLIKRKSAPSKLPKPKPVKLPNPADCKSTSEAARAAITGFLATRDQDHQQG